MQITESGNNEWYTPTEYILSVKEVLGDIDLDPASNDLANRWIKAKVYYDKDNNGLDKRWKGRIWLNPPFSRDLMTQFIDKLISSKRVTEYICLTNASTDTTWFHKMMDDADAICFTKGRISFVNDKGIPTKGNSRGQAFFYKGKNVTMFDLEFNKYGKVVLL